MRIYNEKSDHFYTDHNVKLRVFICMESEQEFTKFSELASELQGEIIKYVDNMSYIGQANKACYAQVRKQQIEYIVDMHRKQDFTMVKLNIPPFVFITGVERYSSALGWYISNETCVIDPNSLNFYKLGTREKWNSSNIRYPNTFLIDHRNEKYNCMRPTNLLIACLEQNESEVKRLLKMYPIKQEHVIKGDSKSEEWYKDRNTRLFFDEALDAAKMIPGNKVMPLLLAHCATESDANN
jgi:hypothetical protein